MCSHYLDLEGLLIYVPLLLQEAFSWRTSQVLLDEDLDMTPFSHPLLDSIDEKLREIEVSNDTYCTCVPYANGMNTLIR